MNCSQYDTDLCTPWKNFQYSESKIPYSAHIFRTSIFLVAPSTAESGYKNKKKWRRLPAVQRLRAIIKYQY